MNLNRPTLQNQDVVSIPATELARNIASRLCSAR